MAGGGWTELGAHYAREERHEKAADVYRRVLARDELHEEALRALMRALAERGERSQARGANRSGVTPPRGAACARTTAS